VAQFPLKKQGICDTVALPFTLKKHLLKQKEELWKFKYFHHAKKNKKSSDKIL
jgi:hypothetical protein